MSQYLDTALTPLRHAHRLPSQPQVSVTDVNRFIYALEVTYFGVKNLFFQGFQCLIPKARL
jgi:hypothetical protein